MHASEASTTRRVLGPLAFLLLFVPALVLLSTTGLAVDESPLAAGATVAWSLLTSGGVALAVLLAAVGLGRPAALACGARAPSIALQAGLGLALTLFLAHGLGVLGLLGGAHGPYVARGVVLTGLLLLAHQVVRGPLRPERWPVIPAWTALAAPALALTLVAACSPPGWLWGSEAGGYDVLSYHLELPKEWAAGGRLWPAAHNVYSYLPSYMESAYLLVAGFLGQTGGPASPLSARAIADPLIAGEGTGVIACQLLHAGVGLLGAAILGRCVWTLLGDADDTSPCSITPAARAGAGIAAAACVLAVPWSVVVGSMAYNEMAVFALGATAILAAVEPRLPPVARGLAGGFATGVACSAKPTAAFMVAPVVALMLLGLSARALRPAQLAALLLAATLAGLAAVAPWLVRNWMASGNPVFPFAAGLFGPGHWTPEQLTRYAAAHTFVGTLTERLSPLLSDRGLRHRHWAFVPPLALTLLAAAASPRTRRAGLLLMTGLALQLAAWLLLTHLQSRFLLPILLPIGLGFGLAIAPFLARSTVRGSTLATAAAVAALTLGLAAMSISGFLQERDGRPNTALTAGVPYFTGELFRNRVAEAAGREGRATEPALDPIPYLNLVLRPTSARVYLLGGAAPLYLAGVASLQLPGSSPQPPFLLYHTTWDRSPLGDAARATLAADPAADPTAGWTGALRALGIDHVLIDPGELRRLSEKDRWYDPDVTTERVRRWSTRETVPVRLWPTPGGAGMALVRLQGGPALRAGLGGRPPGAKSSAPSEPTP